MCNDFRDEAAAAEFTFNGDEVLQTIDIKDAFKEFAEDNDWISKRISKSKLNDILKIMNKLNLCGQYACKYDLKNGEIDNRFEALMMIVLFPGFDKEDVREGNLLEMQYRMRTKEIIHSQKIKASINFLKHFYRKIEKGEGLRFEEHSDFDFDEELFKKAKFYHTFVMNLIHGGNMVEQSIEKAKEELYLDILNKHKTLTFEEFKKHNLRDSTSLFILIDGKVYDMTTFDHPPGLDIYFRNRLSDKLVNFSEHPNHPNPKKLLEMLKQRYQGKLTGTRYIKKEDFDKNDGNDGRNLWILINGVVYDVTTFDHPGGLDVFKKNRENDKADVYYFIESHSKDSDYIMERYYIGFLEKQK